MVSHSTCLADQRACSCLFGHYRFGAEGSSNAARRRPAKLGCVSLHLQRPRFRFVGNRSRSPQGRLLFGSVDWQISAAAAVLVLACCCAARATAGFGYSAGNYKLPGECHASTVCTLVFFPFHLYLSTGAGCMKERWSSMRSSTCLALERLC